MHAVEFQAQIKNGQIIIPEIYQQEIGGMVRVIVLTQPSSPEPDLLDELLKKPLSIPNFKPLPRDEAHGRA